MERICLHCQHPFTPAKRHPKQVYCSRACVMRKNAIAQRLPPFTCAWCGNTFISTDGSAKYCSHKCSGKASNINRKRRPVADRFWEKVEKTDNCWNWIGTLTTHGYGYFSINGHYQIASRVAWELYHGVSPGELHVLHRCDNPRCVREDHLFLGTHRNNMDDKVKKLRHYHGETHRSHKLTEQMVRDIRASKLTQSALSKTYGVGQSVISRIRLRKSWKHVK